MDSGIGLSVCDAGRKSYREHFLPRGWMDSGIGSHAARTVDQTASLSGIQSNDISSASSKSVEPNCNLDARSDLRVEEV